MRTTEWAYYKNKKEQGFISLAELLEGVHSERFELSTLVKAPQGIYWSEIRANPDILNHLPCRYIIDKVI